MHHDDLIHIYIVKGLPPLANKHIHHLTGLSFLYMWEHLNSTLLANFSYTVQCRQCLSPHRTFNPQTLFILWRKVCTLLPTSPYFPTLQLLVTTILLFYFSELDFFFFLDSIYRYHVVLSYSVWLISFSIVPF